MKWPCFIGVYNPTGYIKGIICEQDGFTRYVGTVLYYHYRSTSKIEKLISLGDIYSLGENINPMDKLHHTIHHPEDKTVVAKHRDMGLPIEIYRGIKFNDIGNLGVERIYLWVPEDKMWMSYKVEWNYDKKEVIRVVEEYVRYREYYLDAVYKGLMSEVIL